MFHVQSEQSPLFFPVKHFSPSRSHKAFFLECPRFYISISLFFCIYIYIFTYVYEDGQTRILMFFLLGYGARRKMGRYRNAWDFCREEKLVDADEFPVNLTFSSAHEFLVKKAGKASCRVRIPWTGIGSNKGKKKKLIGFQRLKHNVPETTPPGITYLRGRGPRSPWSFSPWDIPVFHEKS